MRQERLERIRESVRRFGVRHAAITFNMSAPALERLLAAHAPSPDHPHGPPAPEDLRLTPEPASCQADTPPWGPSPVREVVIDPAREWQGEPYAPRPRLRSPAPGPSPVDARVEAYLGGRAQASVRDLQLHFRDRTYAALVSSLGRLREAGRVGAQGGVYRRVARGT